jgi:O-antigen/teichoic acid export membrane protein
MDYFINIYKKTGTVTLNALANISGRLWSSLLSLLTIPVYVHYLGAEAYGLIGFFAIFDVVFNILDFGLSTTINREIARNLATNADSANNKVILRTFEVIYWSIGVMITLVLFSSAGWLASNWVNASTLSTSDVHLALIVVSLAFLARWPISLYTGVLRGLQAQVLQNIILIGASTFRLVGGILVIILVAPTIHVYVIWFAIANGLEITLIYFAAWTKLNRLAPKAHAFFDFKYIKTTWKFALSFNIVGVIGMIVSSADRITISKMLPLKELGYYSIASTATGVMPLISIALMTALFPRFVGYLFGQNTSELLNSFRQSFGLLSFLSVGFAFVVVFYGQELLFIWTHDADIVSNAYFPLAFLALASMANAISNVPYTLLVSQGQTRVLLFTNLVSAVIYIPLLPFAISKYGLTGSAFLFFLLNGILLFCFLFLVSTRLFRFGLIKSPILNVLLYLMLGLICIGLPSLFLRDKYFPFVMLFSGVVYFAVGFMLFRYQSTPSKDVIPEAAK